MRLFLIIFYLTSFTFHSCAQTGESKIDKKDIKAFMKVLTSDSLEGRGTGTEGQIKAQRFIAERFKELGLHPFHQNSYLEKFKLQQNYLGQVYIKVQSETLENFVDMVFQGNNFQNSEIEKEVIFGGLGTDEELDKIDVRDRIVLLFIKNLRSHYEVSTSLKRKGAYGIILANPDNDKQFESIKNTFKDFSLQKRLSFPINDTTRRKLAPWDTIKMINSIVIPNAKIKTISGLSQRELIKLIKMKKIEDAPIVNVKVKFEKIRNEIETANVIGIVKGKSNRTIVVSAHYDHLGKSGKEYFPGADDNASGTTALLELASEFSQRENLNYNIIFLATSGEEAGLLGSHYHVNQAGFDSTTIICDLNLDMISRVDDKHSNGKYLYVIGTDQSTKMDSLVRKADSLFDKCSFDYSLNNSKEPAGLFTRSDNYSFYKKGILSIHFFAGLNSDYHKPTDTMEKIDFQNLENRVRQISLVIELLQNGANQD